MKGYDVVVVGSGTAGQTAAHRLASQGLTVAVAEHATRPGGTCALAGCQAKKYFYEAAETIAKARHLTGLGLVDAPRGVWGDIQRHKRKFTDRVPAGTRDGLAKAGIDLLTGTAAFRDPETLAVDGQPVETRFVVLATGAVPMPLPIEGGEHLITSDRFLDLTTLPRRIIFVGGGFISFEFAHFAVRLGPAESRAVILEAGPRPLGPFDAETVERLVAASAEEGIAVHSATVPTAVRRDGEVFRVETKGGGTFEADLVVHGAGRAPHLEPLHLEAAGIDFSTRGIAVDAAMRTSNPRVFAAGDCAATVQLARVADREARVAADTILAELGRGEPAAMDYTAVPAVLFTYPQVGMVGRTEQALEADGVGYRKSSAAKVGFPTYRRIGMAHAGYKLLADEEGRLLGLHVLSDNVEGLVAMAGQAVASGMTVAELHRRAVMTPYPTRVSDLTYMLAPLLE